MKAILITLISITFFATTGRSQETKTIEPVKVNTEKVKFKAEDGEKSEKKRKKVRAKIKAEKGSKKKKKVKFKAADGEEPKKVKANANF